LNQITALLVRNTSVRMGRT